MLGHTWTLKEISKKREGVHREMTVEQRYINGSQ